MNIAYGIKGKTAEKEAYGRRKIWSREKKEQVRGKREITPFLFISHKLIILEKIIFTKKK